MEARNNCIQELGPRHESKVGINVSDDFQPSLSGKLTLVENSPTAFRLLKSITQIEQHGADLGWSIVAPPSGAIFSYRLPFVIFRLTRLISIHKRRTWNHELVEMASLKAQHLVVSDDVLGHGAPVLEVIERLWKARRKQFKVNWTYLLSETRNTTLFLQTLRFEKLKIKEGKRDLKYDRQEMAIVALIAEATELRWNQVRWQVALQLRSKLGLNIDRNMFLTLLAYYKDLEKGMIVLAEVEGQWLKDMLMERLGLTEWRLIEGGGQSDPDPA